MPSRPTRKPRVRLAVVTDSSACLPAEMLAEQQIIVVPLVFQFDGEQFKDGQLLPREFYRRLERSRTLPTTSAPGPGEFLDAFRQAEEAGATEVLCLTLSAEYSGTYAAARNAADAAKAELPGIHVQALDTGGLAMTHGFAVLEAARAAQAGATLEEAAGIARAVGSRAEMIGVLDTMRFLVKSGRVPWVMHWAASLLHIRPVLAFEGGRPRSIGRVRTAEKGTEMLVAYLQGKAGPPERMHVAVMHANAPERAAVLAERAREAIGPAELIVAEFTTVMGVHTGPGFLGLAFYSDEGIPRPAAPARPRRWLLERDVRVLEEALGELPAEPARPAVVVLSGLPGAGKSHLARELVKRRPFAHLDSDRLRRALFKRPAYTQAEHARLFNAYHELMGRLLRRGVSVVCDATNLREAHRRPLYEIAEKHGARLVVVQVEAPPTVAKQRLERRLAGGEALDLSEAGPEVYARMRAEAEPIRREHIVVDTSGDIGWAVERILREVA